MDFATNYRKRRILGMPFSKKNVGKEHLTTKNWIPSFVIPSSTFLYKTNFFRNLHTYLFTYYYVLENELQNPNFFTLLINEFIRLSSGMLTNFRIDTQHSGDVLCFNVRITLHFIEALLIHSKWHILRWVRNLLQPAFFNFLLKNAFLPSRKKNFGEVMPLSCYAVCISNWYQQE